MRAVRERVQPLKKINGFEILPAAESVRQPLPFWARIIEIQHRGDGIYPQPVDVVLIEPEQRVRQEEVPHFVPAVIENQRTPVLVLALARIRVFEKRRAVESRQSVLVFRKVTGHPVEDQRDASLMKGVDEILEVFR